MEFKEFNIKIQKQFDKMCQTGKLFRSVLSGQEIWNLYLSSFKPEDNPVFRDPNSSKHNCNCCNNFIRRYGNIIALDNDLNIMTIFDIDSVDEYQNSVIAISKVIKKLEIKNVFFETYNELQSLPYEKCNKSNQNFKLGIDINFKQYNKEEAELYGVVKEGEIREFNHFSLSLPRFYVDMSGNSIESIMANYRDSKEVFKRAMDEISLDTLILVKDLINQGSLLDGQTHLYKIDQIIPLKQEYDSFENNKKDNWCWIKSFNLPYAKFKNELIGVLCSELSEGEELNKACQNWNKRVDPVNYMKVTAPITKKQIEEAQKFVQENGYEESFNRRLATVEDIKVSEILHSNIGDGEIKSVSIFDNVKATSTRHKRNEFEGVEQVSIEKFMRDILPGCTSVEVFLKNQHEGNLVTLTTSNIENSKPIFKWSNNYSWTFNGNLAGKSMIKKAVKSRGGKTEGVLNIRLAFPDTTSDYDLHVVEPSGTHISYENVRHVHPSSGVLDLDAQGVDGYQSPEKRVENIIYTELQKMKQGDYNVYINDYSGSRFPANFIVEIETNDDIVTMQYNTKKQSNNVNVCQINLNNKFEIMPTNEVELISSNSISKKMYELETNQFHKVNLICLSPNHWGENNVGNKHYLFILDGCKTIDKIRGFHNENLIPELLQHRKVMEVLGNTAMIEPSDKQLSGIGFNATVKDELIVKLKGSFKRIINIKF